MNRKDKIDRANKGKLLLIRKLISIATQLDQRFVRSRTHNNTFAIIQIRRLAKNIKQ